MIFRMRYYITILFLVISLPVTGQTKAEVELLRDHPVNKHEKHVNSGGLQDQNELQQVTSVLFIGYKKFISSQDVASCVFYPSCSEYAIQSIRTRGFFIGLLNAFDRLSRCNAFSADKYPIMPGTYLLYDPVMTHEK